MVSDQKRRNITQNKLFFPGERFSEIHFSETAIYICFYKLILWKQGRKMAQGEQGDGWHNGGNHPNFPNVPRGDFPPADQLHIELLAWLNFLLHHELLNVEAPFMLEEWIEVPANVQNAGHDDDENHDDAVNENHGNNENQGNADNNNNNIDNNNVDNDIINEHVEDVGARDEVGVNQGVEDDPLPGPSRRSGEQELEEITVRNGQQFRLWDDTSDSDSDNTDYTGKSPVVHIGAGTGVAEENPPLPGPSRKKSREDGLDVEERSWKRLRFSDVFNCMSGRNTDCDEHAGTSAEAAADDPLPGPPRGSSKEEAGQIVRERSFENFRWWDEFDFTSNSDTDNDDPVCGSEFVEEDPLPGPSKRPREDGQDDEQRSRKRVRLCEDLDCTSDKDSDKTDCDNISNKNVGNSPAEPAGPNATVAEENPLPGRKRTRKSSRAEEERSSSEKSKEIKFVAGSNSETAGTRSDHDRTCSSSNTDLAEGASAVDETEEKVTKQVGGEDQEPGVSRKRSREDDEGEDKKGKRFKC